MWVFFFFLQTGVTPLQRAAAEGHLEVIDVLLKHAVDVSHQDNIVSKVMYFNNGAVFKQIC